MGSLTATQGRTMPDWPDAACRDNDDPDAWFPLTSHPEIIDPLREICRTCPRRDECLTLAIADREEYGVWGGMTESQRRRIANGSTTIEIEWRRYHDRQLRRRRRAQRQRLESNPTMADDVMTARRIIDHVAWCYGYEPEEIVSTDRTRRLIDARHEAMRRVREATDLSYSAIGAIFDRDHSTVLSAINRKP